MTGTDFACFEHTSKNPRFAAKILWDYAALILSYALKDNRNKILSPTPGESTTIALSLAHKQIFVVAPLLQNMWFHKRKCLSVGSITRGIPLPKTAPKEEVKRKIVDLLVVDLNRELVWSQRHETYPRVDNDKIVGDDRYILWWS
jgi:hypothetical protein